jgi:HK97 gp10 family phage protein
MGAETSGFNELIVELSALAEAIDNGFGGEGIDEVLKAGAQPILEQAKINAPVGDTGYLKGSLAVKTGSKKSNKHYVTIGVHRGSKGYYAFFVEKGHKGPRPAPPHPFLEPAFDARKDEANTIIRDGLKAKLATLLK